MPPAKDDRPPAAPRRKNMRAQDREKLIVEEAVRFFAECGFEGQTRELAKRMGISHAVIYKHFDSKDALIERVYEHIYLRRWNPAWETLIVNRERPLQDRLTQFYREYAERVFDYDWVRIFVSSGLKSYDLTQRYLSLIRNKVILPAALELRHELSQDAVKGPPSDQELELFWGLHGGIFYIAIRRFVYNVTTDIDLGAAAENAVEVFFNGVEAAHRKAGFQDPKT